MYAVDSHSFRFSFGYWLGNFIFQENSIYTRELCSGYGGDANANGNGNVMTNLAVINVEPHP